MSREILFRGKRLDNGEWVQGYYQEYPLGCAHIATENNDWFVVNPSTVGQFTGLADKNGKKIFEGDILEDTLGWVYAVQWDADCSRFLGFHNKPRGDTYVCYVGREPASEVIGNIHDSGPGGAP